MKNPMKSLHASMWDKKIGQFLNQLSDCPQSMRGWDPSDIDSYLEDLACNVVKLSKIVTVMVAILVAQILIFVNVNCSRVSFCFVSLVEGVT